MRNLLLFGGSVVGLGASISPTDVFVRFCQPTFLVLFSSRAARVEFRHDPRFGQRVEQARGGVREGGTETVACDNAMRKNPPHSRCACFRLYVQ